MTFYRWVREVLSVGPWRYIGGSVKLYRWVRDVLSVGP